jgi:hypothetical protein
MNFHGTDADGTIISCMPENRIALRLARVRTGFAEELLNLENPFKRKVTEGDAAEIKTETGNFAVDAPKILKAKAIAALHPNCRAKKPKLLEY